MINFSLQQKRALINLEKKVGEGKIKINDIEPLLELKYLGQDQEKEYLECREIFKEFQKLLIETFPDKLLIDELKKAHIEGNNRNLTSEEKLMMGQIEIAIQKQQLIIFTIMNLEELKKNFKNQDLLIYLVSNFYRTLCEITPKLLYPNLINIIDFLIKKYEEEILNKEENSENQKRFKEKIKSFKKFKEDIFSGSLGLDDLRIILTSFEKKTRNIGLSKIYEDRLGYISQTENTLTNETGFVLRNIIAHEKKLFGGLKIQEDLSPNIEKVQMFNVSIIFEMYLEFLDEIPLPEITKISLIETLSPIVNQLKKQRF